MNKTTIFLKTTGQKNGKNGLTLIETVVSIGLLLSISLILTTILISSWRNYSAQDSLNKLQLAARGATYEIAKNTRQAVSVISSYTKDYQTYQTTSSSLVLRLPSIDVGENIIPNHYDYIVYLTNFAQPTEGREIVFPDSSSSRTNSNRIITSNLYSLTFSYYDAASTEITNGIWENTTLAEINIVLREATHGQENQANFSTDAKLRNK